jgi:Rrf2 family transcriptional regulator, cysteine metabolism repressor
MQVSQKCQYTLRALFEMAKQQAIGPVPVHLIAQFQDIPPRFLEVILQGLRRSGMVDSRRGLNGGYVLTVPPETITVGHIIRLIDGTLSPVGCTTGDSRHTCQLLGRCVFLGLWRRAEAAVEAVFDTTTLQDLLDQERTSIEQQALTDYVI